MPIANKNSYKANLAASPKAFVKQQGFTLVELILVILILGIIAVGSTQFIVNSVKGLNDVSRRDAIANSLRINIEKIKQKLENSLAYSVRLKSNENTQCIEMLPINATAFYTQAPFTKQGFNLSAVSLDQSVIGLRAVIPDAVTPGNITAAFYTDSLAINSGVISSHIKRQQPIDDDSITILTFYAAHKFINPSAQQKLYFVKQPISYCLQNNRLIKYSNYGYHSLQLLADKMPNKEPRKVLLAKDMLAGSRFSYNAITQEVGIELKMGNLKESLLINQRIWLSNE